MNRCLFGFVVMAALGGAVLADAKTDADLKKLEGDWEIESVESKGKKLEGLKGKAGGLNFGKDMKLVMSNPGQKDKTGTYKIDAGKKPKEIDLVEGKDGEKGSERVQAIYEVGDEKLKLGLSAQGPKGKRPSAFDGKETVILHLKRKK